MATDSQINILIARCAAARKNSGLAMSMVTGIGFAFAAMGMGLISYNK